MKNKALQDPQAMLQTAIEEIDRFTKGDVSSLEVGEDGRIVASKQSRLEKVVGLAKSFIGPLFSGSLRREQSDQLEGLKQAVLNARDFIQSHSALILKFQKGNVSQRRLADYALSAIQRYNTVISKKETAETAKYEVYNYQREQLLQDRSISGQPIQLPHTFAVKFDSHPDGPVLKLFKAMEQGIERTKKPASSHSPTHKKTLQFMIDTFHLKAIRLIQTHLSQQNSMAEIVPIVKESPLEIDDETNPELIAMQQLLEIGPGFFILVSGCFKKNNADSKFLTMPMIDTFRLSFQLTHTGFPYPSEYHGASLGNEWVDASPLRSEQTPHFQEIDQRRKQLAHSLVYDKDFIQSAHRLAKLKKEIFDQNREMFLSFYQQFQFSLREDISNEEKIIIESFIKEVKRAHSSFDALVGFEQQIQNLFMKEPLKALEEEWLDANSELRIADPQEKFRIVSKRLAFFRSKAMDAANSHLRLQGNLLGNAFQAIALQYLSEKMGFSPPLLSDFERKLQFCAFHQLLSFLEESKNLDSNQIKEQMINAWKRELKIIQSPSIDEENSLPLKIVNELEFYFNSRFRR